MGSPTCPTCGSSHRDVYGGCRVVVGGRYSPDPWHHAPSTPPAPADDARPMVTGGGLIKFDRILDHAAGGAGDAGVMRERAASILDKYAKNAATLAETKPEDGFEDRREEFQGTASILRAIAAQIRRLPLPARREDAREAVVEAAMFDVEQALAEAETDTGCPVDTGLEDGCVSCHWLTDLGRKIRALRAALRGTRPEGHGGGE